MPACAPPAAEDVASIEAHGETITAGDRVRIEPSNFEPAEFPPEFTIKTFSFEGTLLDSSSDLVLIPTVSVFAGSGNGGGGLSMSETLKNSEKPIHWSSGEATRSVEIDYLYLPGMGRGGYQGSGRLYLYLTDEDGTCMSNIVAWPVTFK